MKRRLSEMWLLIVADRKRAAILGTLLLVLGGVGIKMFLLDGPRRARASTADAPSEKSSSGSKGNQRSSGSRADASRTGKSQPLGAERRTVVMAPSVKRDLFTLDNERYKPLQTEPADNLAPLAGKSQTGSADNDPVPDPDAARKRVLDDASRLRLRSILLGSKPSAVIENSGGRRSSSVVVAVGQTIEGFTLVSIESNGVVIEKDGVQAQLHRELPEH